MANLNLIKPLGVQNIINKFCFTIGMIPSSYKLSLTYEEQILSIGKYLEETVIPALNNNAEAVAELQTLFVQLKDYVENYFDNLDVQQEINNKIDQMVESGTLNEIITSYLSINGVICFNNIEELKNAENLINGSFVRTFGFYGVNDGGQASYKITNEGVANDLTIFELKNGLFAHLIFDKITLNAKQVGVHCDKATDDTFILQKTIDFCKLNNYDLLIKGYAYISSTIDTKGIKIKGEGKMPKGSATYTSSKYGYIGWDYLRNINNGALITFEDYVDDVLKSGSGIISDTASPILKCAHKQGKFNLENICICGWLRNTYQEGLLSTYETDDTYINGIHKFNNVSVLNCGNNGIHLQSLELTEFKNNNISYNGNYGLFIEGIDEIDTPTEYSFIINNIIEGNFNHGIYIENSFNKLLNIINNDFSRNGLYKQLNKEVPNENYIVGCYIKDRKSTKASQENLIFEDNYGEEIQNLLTINISNDGTNIFNNISVNNNIIYPLTANTSYLLELNGISYTDNLEISQNNSNGGNITKNNSSRTGFKQTPLQIIPVTYISSLVKDGVSARKQGQHVHIEFYGNFNAEVPQYSTLVSGLPKSISNYRLHCFAHLINPTTGYFQKTVACVLGTNGNLSTEEVIPNGSRISCILDYFCADNVL